MFCPQCHDEYRPEFVECADCHVPLVAQLDEAVPGAAPDAESELCEVFRTSSPHEANLVKSLLESSGIDVSDVDGNICSIWPQMGMVEGIKLAVPKADVEAANEILKEARGKEGEDPNYGSPTPFLWGVGDDQPIQENRTDEAPAADSPPAGDAPKKRECPQCFAEVTESDSRFCDQCGAWLSQ